MIFASIMTLMLISLLLYLEVIENQAKIDAAADRRYQSYLLADELRQSSDDLTRMARTYTVTGNPKFKEYFDKILAIRSGDAPRPVDYHNIYWDFISATGIPPRPDTFPKPLKELMKEAEFTETEFALLRETEDESNELVNLENRAMNAMVGLFDNQTKGVPNQGLARNLLHGEQYHLAKEKIMKPLDRFFETLDYRTSGEIAGYRDKQWRLNVVLMITLALAAGLALLSLILGAATIKKRDAQSGKSRLAKRLAASGYTSPVSEEKASAREALVRRLTSKTAPEEEKENTTADATSLQFFLRNFWQGWPLIVAAVVVTFMILGLSWWFLSENRIQSYAKVRDELKFTLDATQNATLDWMHETSQDTVKFAQAASRQLSLASLQALQEFPLQSPERQAAGLARPNVEQADEIAITQSLQQFPESFAMLNPEIVEDYLIVDNTGIVLSSSRGRTHRQLFYAA